MCKSNVHSIRIDYEHSQVRNNCQKHLEYGETEWNCWWKWTGLQGKGAPNTNSITRRRDYWAQGISIKVTIRKFLSPK